jgi:hypothetical protein
VQSNEYLVANNQHKHDVKCACELRVTDAVHMVESVHRAHDTAHMHTWLSSIHVPLLIQRSPVAHFLHDYYFNDEIGQSPVYGVSGDDHRGERH